MTEDLKSSPLTAVEVAEALETAVDYVRQGWNQGGYAVWVDDRRHVCSSGALWLALGGNIERGPRNVSLYVIRDAALHERWAQVLELLHQQLGQSLVDWNDSIGQTQDRVVDTMLRIAKELRPNEAP